MASELSWGAVKALFDVNFVFRKSESEPGERWYRKDANGPYIWVKEQGGAVHVGLQDPLGSLPEGVSEVKAGAFSSAQLHCYRVNSMAGLEQLVSAFKKAPVTKAVASKPVSPQLDAPVSSMKAHQMASNTILYGPP